MRVSPEQLLVDEVSAEQPKYWDCSADQSKY
jgi:hypothetical protein